MTAPIAVVWPLPRSLVRTWDNTERITRTLTDSASEPPAAENRPATAVALDQLPRWTARSQAITRADAATRDSGLTRAVPPAVRSNYLLGGLAGAHAVHALLLAEAMPGWVFAAGDCAHFTALLEPVAAAIDAHQRLCELTVLRASADAGRARLLTRLGHDQQNDLIGRDGGLKAVFERITQIAKSDRPVLIRGLTGSGKQRVARQILQRSPRAAAPFVRINCGAIAPALIDAELFGHARGSCTGACRQRQGWCERANSGTLLLDEIGELPLAVQARLLPVLQDRLLRRIGGPQDIRMSVRSVAATHRDLPVLIQGRRFRQGLWYRLAAFSIVLPPLRARRGDIPVLTRHFAQRAAQRFGLRVQLPTADDVAALDAYDWPGNVREFAVVLDRAARLGDGHRLEVVPALGVAPVAVRRDGPESPAPTAATSDAFPALDHAVRRHLEAALARTRRRIAGRHGAARLLDINPHTLCACVRACASSAPTASTSALPSLRCEPIRSHRVRPLYPRARS